MAEPLGRGDRTASQIQQDQLAKPVQERDAGLMKDVAKAQLDTNMEQQKINEIGKAAGLVVNNFKAEPVFDDKGKIRGYTVR